MPQRLLFALSLLFVCGSSWRLWEQDIFWQIRMGEELLSTFSVFRTDNWSYSVPGFSDINFWWLPSVIFYAVYKIGQETALVLLRGIWVGFYFLCCSAILLRRSESSSPQAIGAAILALVLAFVAAAFRFQLRPEFLVALAMAGLIWLWVSDLKQSQKAVLSFVLCWLASNCHMGPQLLVILAATVLVWTTQLSVQLRLTYSFLFAASFFLTPAHIHPILPFLKTFTYGVGREAMKNNDWFSFSPDMFMLSSWGLTGWAWLILITGTLFGLWRGVSEGLFAHPLVRGLTILYLALSFYRSRTILFAIPLFLPYFHAAAALAMASLRPRLIVLMSLLFLMLAAAHIRFYPRPLGLGLDTWVFPSRGVEMLKELRPAGQVLHDPSLGGYMVWKLPEFKVLTDTRQYPYAEVDQKLAEAGRHPNSMRQLMDKYEIGIVFLPIPQMPLSESGLIDTVRPFFSREEWALIYFDNHYMLMLRRKPENQAAIARFEFRHQMPQFPAFYPGEPPGPAAEVDAEVKRCLQATPDNLYCSLRQAFVNGRKAEGLKDVQAVPQYFPYLNQQLEMAQFYGRTEEADFLSSLLW